MWQQLVFPHIPKTAGWALHAALLPIFGEAQSLRINTEDDVVRLRALSPAEFARYRYVSGHFKFEDVKAKCSAGSLLVSVLRDPVRRVVSEFNYMASWAEHPFHAHFKNLKFSDHVRANAAYLDGLQCEWLTGRRNAEGAMAGIADHYALVGAVANYDAFLSALGRLVGCEVRATRTNVTTGQGLLDLDSRLCAMLLDLTTEDRKFVESIAALPDGVFTGTVCGFASV